MQALDPLNNLVAWVIMRIHAVLGSLFGPASGAAWGLSIVILVMFIRLLLVPLFIKQVHAQRKMAQHAPQLQELRKKYKGDKQRLNEETMKFYKENGVNPLAGCLPMIPQMIVFFALFNVLRAITTWTHGHHAEVRADGAGGGERAEGDHLRRPPGRQAAVLAPVGAAPREHRDRADRGSQRHDDVHDRPAEREARSHADQRGPGQPDGPVAEVHAVHRPVLLADRVVLAVRPGALLGDDQPVDAWPAVPHVQELGAHRCRGRVGRPDHGCPGGPGAGLAELATSGLGASGLGASGILGVFGVFGIRCRQGGRRRRPDWRPADRVGGRRREGRDGQRAGGAGGFGLGPGQERHSG